MPFLILTKAIQPWPLPSISMLGYDWSSGAYIGYDWSSGAYIKNKKIQGKMHVDLI